ncbi:MULTISPECIES: branched-chain amino acid ABC transporter permease [unclassified Beijerinckia]|uniref:branched-chain amino acid ABC transporter permease n=1 Tax=unclassified Beijerinckia TaxID=2638183 RepID=UPI0008970F49|nr:MULTISPECIES: branched-chain amino acid ABC transporter permease [unclassified Beijerinckia]MDH7797597.1 branched-chain amino acid transport system permease protein [Beijerinckia sp. GAS462]SEC91849.1 amino acid/amide ABC transporter membrane protein 1, HAAT family [Beijerinckia sp. 28-YEA-48]
MTPDIAAILGVDGIATGAIYVLVAIGTVLIFTVTRVIFIPFGDIAAFTALTLAALDTGQVPGTIGLLAGLACLATVIEVTSLVRKQDYREIPSALLYYLVIPLAIALAVRLLIPLAPPLPVRLAMALLLILPIAPLLDRIVFRPIADGTVLLLLIVSVALHFALVGLGLLFFGPEGVRTEPLTSYHLDVAGIILSGQTILIVVAAVVFSALLFLFFDFTLVGKSLRATAVNRTGARLMGIRPARAGTVAYLLGSLMAGVSGILIAPVNTIFYDSGFLIGLKAFVGAIIGGLSSYPGTAIGALFVGILESFASFQSSAFKDVIVFSMLIPILIWRSLATLHSEEEVDE